MPTSRSSKTPHKHNASLSRGVVEAHNVPESPCNERFSYFSQMSVNIKAWRPTWGRHFCPTKGQLQKLGHDRACVSDINQYVILTR